MLRHTVPDTRAPSPTPTHTDPPGSRSGFSQSVALGAPSTLPPESGPRARNRDSQVSPEPGPSEGGDPLGHCGVHHRQCGVCSRPARLRSARRGQALAALGPLLGPWGLGQDRGCLSLGHSPASGRVLHRPRGTVPCLGAGTSLQAPAAQEGRGDRGPRSLVRVRLRPADALSLRPPASCRPRLAVDGGSLESCPVTWNMRKDSRDPSGSSCETEAPSHGGPTPLRAAAATRRTPAPAPGPLKHDPHQGWPGQSVGGTRRGGGASVPPRLPPALGGRPPHPTAKRR